MTEWQKVVHIEGVTIQKQFIIGSCLVLVLAAVVQDLAVRYELLIPAPVSCIILIIWQILTLIIHFTKYYTYEYIKLKIYPHGFERFSLKRSNFLNFWARKTFFFFKQVRISPEIDWYHYQSANAAPNSIVRHRIKTDQFSRSVTSEPTVGGGAHWAL